MPRSGMFRCLRQKSGMLCFFGRGQFISNHCACRNQTTLQIGNTHEYAVRRQICCLSRASCGIVEHVAASSVAPARCSCTSSRPWDSTLGAPQIGQRRMFSTLSQPLCQGGGCRLGWYAMPLPSARTTKIRNVSAGEGGGLVSGRVQQKTTGVRS